MSRKFHLHRTEDPSGVSGTGDVAEGIVFHDGQTVISWFGALHSVEVWPSIEAAEQIHGHQGKTKVVYDDADGESFSGGQADGYKG